MTTGLARRGPDRPYQRARSRLRIAHRAARDDKSERVAVRDVRHASTRETFMFKIIGGTVGIIFLIGLLVVVGIFMLIF
jgi:hypothetical protein